MQHGIGERFERRAALRALEEEIGMRRDAKRRLVQAEVLEVERHGLLVLAVAVHTAVKRRAIDAQQLRRLADVAARQAQRRLDVAALPGPERVVEVEAAGALELAQGLLDNGAAFAARRRCRRLEIELGLELGDREPLPRIFGR